MKRLWFFASLVLLVSADNIAQDLHSQILHSQIQDMKKSYAGSGSIVAVDDHTMVIEPNMPGPICALPQTRDGKTNWSFFAFPLASITVPLSIVDQDLVTEDEVFTNPDEPNVYKPGDVGDTTMVMVVTVPGKQFHTLMYDRDKLAQLGPGPHRSSDYGQTPDDVIAFRLTFTDHAAARAFEAALKDAVLLAKAQAARR